MVVTIGAWLELSNASRFVHQPNGNLVVRPEAQGKNNLERVKNEPIKPLHISIPVNPTINLTDQSVKKFKKNC